MDVKELPVFTPTIDPICTGNVATIQLDNKVESFTVSWTSTSAQEVNVVGESDGVDSYTTTETFTNSTNFSIVGYANGCASEKKTASLTVNAKPDIQITCDPIDKATCQETGTATLTATGGVATQYVWTLENTVIANGTDKATISNINTAGSYTYKVVGENESGCQNEASIAITVNEKPTVSIKVEDGPICVGSSKELTAESTAGTYVWYNENGQQVGVGEKISPVFNSTTAVKYSVEATDNNGCKATTVTIPPVTTFPVNGSL